MDSTHIGYSFYGIKIVLYVRKYIPLSVLGISYMGFLFMHSNVQDIF